MAVPIIGLLLLFERILTTGKFIIKKKRLEQRSIILKIKYKTINEDKKKWKHII